MLLRKSAAVGLAAFGLTLGPAYYAGATVLPVQNLGFNQYNAGGGLSASQEKDTFANVKPTGWSIGSGGGSPLIFVGQQGSEGFTGSPSTADIYAVYTNPGFSNTVPVGTNFYQADGNPSFEDTIFQTVSGLTASTYTLQFQQAAGQQTGFSGATTEQWKVFLGVGGIGTSCSGGSCSITGLTGNVEADSTLMNTASQANTNWNNVNLSFNLPAGDISSGNAVLTFLAWGDGGSTTNLPPTVFLEGVNTTPVPTPEPATLTILGVGLLGLGGIKWFRRGKPNASV